jgi:PAS domain S-box-containing protein
MKAKYPELRTRLALAFILIFCLAIVSTVFVYLKFSDLHHINQRMLEHPYRVSNNLKDILLLENRSMNIAEMLLHVKTQSEIDELEADLHASQEKISELFEIVRQRYLGDEQDVVAASKLSLEIKNDLALAFEKKKKMEEQELQAFLQQYLPPKLDEFSKKMDVLIAFADKNIQAFHSESMTIWEKSIRHMSLFFISVFIVALLITFWIFSSVNTPLRNIIHRLDKTMGKSYANYKHINIIKLLDETVMQLDQFKNRLEEKVEKRTAEIESARQKLEVAIEKAPLGIVSIDLNGQFIKVNKHFTELLGYTEQELLQKNFNDITHPEDLGIGISKVKAMLDRQLDKVSFEKRYMKKNGEVVHAHITSAVIYNKENQAEYFFTQILDISERKKAALELEKIHQNLETLVEERTKELSQKNKALKLSNEELEKFNDLFVGREFRIKELKEEISRLKNLNQSSNG